jgi:hypothetical protein
VRGFCAADYADLYTAEVDNLLIQLEKDIRDLVLLKVRVRVSVKG